MTTDLAAGRANTIGIPARLVEGVLVVGYPVVVYLGLTHFTTRLLGFAMLGMLGTRLALGLRPAAAAQIRPLIVQLLPVAGLVALAVVLDDRRFMLALPVLISLTLLVVFARSLLGEVSIIERIARLQDPDLTAAEASYCTNVTWVWCGFFVLNAVVVSVLAVAAPLSWWTLYTALLSYALIGALMAAEFVVRRHRFRRFGDGLVDQLVRTLLDKLPASGAKAADEPPLDWTQIAEKGSVLGVRTVVFLCIWLGRPVVRFSMRIVAAYYLFSDAKLRRISREFHERVGVRPTWGTVYRHIRCFAYTASDRIFLLRGEKHLFELSVTGLEHAERVRRAGTGGILVGAHFGSFEALRAAAEEDDIQLSIVAYFHNAAMSNAAFESLEPGLAERVIQVEPGRVDPMLKIRKRIQAGEFVAFLGDRHTPGAETVEVDFLGDKARFPTGALAVAATLGCPVLLVFSVYRDPNVYEMHCEPFAERIELPRRGGMEEKRVLVQRYARRLEYYARQAPDNWSNFYDFWAE